MKSIKRISVVIPIYYGEKYISTLIQQIEECRKYLDKSDSIEVIFVNDAPDAPLDCRWKSKIVDITIINSDVNIGIHGTRVKGLKKCRGEYILFLDQDDVIGPTYFYSQLQAIEEKDAVICKALEGGKEVYSEEGFKSIASKEFVLKMWNQIISPGQVLIRKEAIPDIWIKNIMKYNGADDWFLWLCMFAEKCEFSLNESILYEHILQDSNASYNIAGMVQSEQEVLCIIQQQEIFSDNDMRLLMEGFYKINLRRTKWLYNAKIKAELLDKWMTLRENNRSFGSFLIQEGIHEVAIYGCGIFGKHLYSELKSTVDVKCFIDRNAENIKEAIPVYTLQNISLAIDAVIITLAEGIKQVEDQIKNRLDTRVIVLRNWIIETYLNIKI